mmetsp:Transcript_50845/g.82213  ORF Transcript_50845/g.82213 Transcript_50845/m.82213 type:complete len:199 (+) Transcript_50845:380-976(+)
MWGRDDTFALADSTFINIAHSLSRTRAHPLSPSLLYTHTPYARTLSLASRSLALSHARSLSCLSPAHHTHAHTTHAHIQTLFFNFIIENALVQGLTTHLFDVQGSSRLSQMILRVAPAASHLRQKVGDGREWILRFHRGVHSGSALRVVRGALRVDCVASKLKALVRSDLVGFAAQSIQMLSKELVVFGKMKTFDGKR